MQVSGTTRNILGSKGRDIWTTTPDALVFDAIHLMGEKNIGALIVVENGEVVGLMSERDYSRKVVLRGRTSRDTRVEEILSRPVVTVGLDTSIDDCMRLMTEHRIRHLPVVENGSPAGLVSMGDLIKWTLSAQEDAIHQLEGYIAGQFTMR
ncbi:CBS domain-containing protein [Luteolibacter marinus]|uniref:CBS domain-containing protein n=1 Tax=Luteolibacter marinus TaxID=2776705 RepID=UPI001867EDBD|nr:CBS domain-containing protein [Luteolibacter marinus]